MRRHLQIAVVSALALAGCTSQPRVVPVASAPAPIAPAAPAFFGYGNLAVPTRLADGSFATPNHGVSAAATIWHLRAGLNVAALSCRGTQEAALVAGYNALLQRHRAEFDRAYQALGTEHGGVAAFDAAMTRLYNYYALPPAQAGLCGAAQAVLADATQLPVGGLAGFAPAALSRIDRPYTQVFAAQETWLAGRDRPAATLMAAAAPPAPAPTVAPTRPIAPVAVAVAAPPATPVVTKAAFIPKPAPMIAIDPTVASAKLPVAAVAVAAVAPHITVDQAVFRQP